MYDIILQMDELTSSCFSKQDNSQQSSALKNVREINHLQLETEICHDGNK